jgi:Asp-tRNA(Asn)/Glu-tRNA(Gln) amidotransferase A subunit family amidase
MPVAEYASYDAVGLAELVRKREVSPTELVEAAIERIEKPRMRQLFPKLRLCPILKASCSSLTESESRVLMAIRRR